MGDFMNAVKDHIQEGLEQAVKFRSSIYKVNQKNAFGVDLNLAAEHLSRIVNFGKEIAIIETDLSDIKDSELGEISGYTSFKKDRIYIIVNENDTSYRKRFTVAHELGHIFMGDLTEENSCFFRSQAIKTSVNKEYIKIEQRANAFASELLMPTKEVEYLIQKGFTTEKLAVIFGVSFSAMRTKVGIIFGY
jgi:Zn-dependent peptidase ImmA (M78 family)